MKNALSCIFFYKSPIFRDRYPLLSHTCRFLEVLPLKIVSTASGSARRTKRQRSDNSDCGDINVKSNHSDSITLPLATSTMTTLYVSMSYRVRSPSLTQPSLRQPALISGARIAGSTKLMSMRPAQSMPVIPALAPDATSATQPE